MTKETFAALIIGARMMSPPEFRAAMARLGYVHFLPAPLDAEQIHELAHAVMVAEKDASPQPSPKEREKYVIVDELPEDQREPLTKWLISQTLPAPQEANGLLCCWRWDYDRWFAFWSAGQIASVFD